MSQRKLEARILRRTPLYTGFLKVARYEIDTERHAGGFQRLTREVMERGDAVAVLAYDPARDAVVLVNEMRPGALAAGDYPYTDNLIAGALDAGESPLRAAVRETKEETGLDLEDPVIVHPGAFVSSGGTSEKIVIVFGFVDASTAGGIHGNPEEQEDILSVVLPAEEFIARTRRAEITDLKTLVAGYWLAEYRAGRPPATGDPAE
ncbi:MAG TPA: NUDIX domain-containing protein [Woeseiaceae bacterium]|nr:NUDIX domain-containing protein [Woeseiaceae bacterium]